MDIIRYGGQGPETEEEKRERYAIDQCSVSLECGGSIHLKECPLDDRESAEKPAPPDPAKLTAELENLVDEFEYRHVERGRYAEAGYGDAYNDGATDAINFFISKLVAAGYQKTSAS